MVLAESPVEVFEAEFFSVLAPLVEKGLVGEEVVFWAAIEWDVSFLAAGLNPL